MIRLSRARASRFSMCLYSKMNTRLLSCIRVGIITLPFFLFAFFFFFFILLTYIPSYIMLQILKAYSGNSELKEVKIISMR